MNRCTWEMLEMTLRFRHADCAKSSEIFMTVDFVTALSARAPGVAGQKLCWAKGPDTLCQRHDARQCALKKLYLQTQ